MATTDKLSIKIIVDDKLTKELSKAALNVENFAEKARVYRVLMHIFSTDFTDIKSEHPELWEALLNAEPQIKGGA